VKVRSLDSPIVHYSIGLAAEYKAQELPKERKRTGTKHAHLIKRMLTYKDPNDRSGFANVTGKDGVMRPAKLGVGPGNGDQIVWLYGRDLEGMDVNFTWAFTADAANGTGEGKPTRIRKRRSCVLSALTRTTSTIWARSWNWAWARNMNGTFSINRP